MSDVTHSNAVQINHSTKTIQPLSDIGDDYFGLTAGTNGTAAICRRALVDAPAEYQWVRSNGRAAIGIQFVPTANSEGIAANPWSGK